MYAKFSWILLYNCHLQGLVLHKHMAVSQKAGGCMLDFYKQHNHTLKHLLEEKQRGEQARVYFWARLTRQREMSAPGWHWLSTAVREQGSSQVIQTRQNQSTGSSLLSTFALGSKLKFETRYLEDISAYSYFLVLKEFFCSKNTDVVQTWHFCKALHCCGLEKK